MFDTIQLNRRGEKKDVFNYFDYLKTVLMCVYLEMLIKPLQIPNIYFADKIAVLIKTYKVSTSEY